MKDLDDNNIDSWLLNVDNFDSYYDNNSFLNMINPNNLTNLTNFNRLFNFNEFDNINTLIPPTDIIPNLNGIYNYRIPTDEQFAYCQEVNGTSIWDKNGWWKCLFPNEHITKILNSRQLDNNSSIKLDNMITKEKINLKDYFTDYTHYLLWKLKNERDKNSNLIEANNNEREKQDLISKNFALDNKFPEGLNIPEDISIKNNNDNSLFNASDENKKIIGKEQSISVKNSNDKKTNNEETKITKLFYDDGSILVKRLTKSTPKDGSKPIINETENWEKKSIDKNSRWF